MYCVGDKVKLSERVRCFGYNFNENEVFTVTEVLEDTVRINAQFIDPITIEILENETYKGIRASFEDIEPAIVRESMDLML